MNILKSSYIKGVFAETIVSLYLRLHFYKILRRRYKTGNYTGRAEIDIIAKRLNSITENQNKRLVRAAETFLLQYYPNCCARFDLIALCPPKIFWIKNI